MWHNPWRGRLGEPTKPGVRDALRNAKPRRGAVVVASLRFSTPINLFSPTPRRPAHSASAYAAISKIIACRRYEAAPQYRPPRLYIAYYALCIDLIFRLCALFCMSRGGSKKHHRHRGGDGLLPIVSIAFCRPISIFHIL